VERSSGASPAGAQGVRGTLVTGAEGFVGRRLLARLLAAGPVDPLWAWARRPPALRDPRVRWQVVDLEDPRAALEAVLEARPAHLYHLAAVASPPACAADPERAFRVNVGGTAAVAEGARLCGSRLLLASSAQVYGPQGGRLAETRPLAATSVYGRTKRAAEGVVRRAGRGGLWAVVARSFNHSGPGQSADYVLPALVEQVRAALRSGGNVLTGNLYPRRDFLHVDDVLDAYRLLLERGAPGEAYNVCSGEGHSIDEALRGLQARLGAQGQRTRVDPGRARSGEAEELIGDPEKLSALGFAPAISFEALLDDATRPAL
jgi:GDP-4-dehydro-6-deoxy-D-mannose reductase